MSVEHVSQQVKELKKSLTEMDKSIKKAPEDFRKQMKGFLEVCTTAVDHDNHAVLFDALGGKQ